MRVLVVLNAAAGADNGDERSSRAARVSAAFARHGARATIRAVAGAEISAAVRQVVSQYQKTGAVEFDALVVGGGDGTISAAAAQLAGQDVPLGILAFGTLNHFAKDLGLPLDLDEAVGVIMAGNVRSIDVAQVNGRVFVNNSSLGLYPFMVASRNAEQRRTGLGKFAATFPAIVRTLRRSSWRNLGIVRAGLQQRVRTPCVFVGNNLYDTSIAGFGTRSRLDGGELGVSIVKQQTRLGLLLLPFAIALKRTDKARDLETFCAKTLEITSKKHHLRVSLDGEIAVLSTPLHYRTRPAALKVLAPPR